MASDGRATRSFSKSTYLAPGALSKKVRNPKIKLLPGFFSNVGDGLQHSKSVETRIEDGTTPHTNNMSATNIEKESTQTKASNGVPSLDENDGPSIIEENVGDVKNNMTEDVQGNNVVSKMKKRATNSRTRGVNKCRRVAKLGEGQKLNVEFFNNGPVGDNYPELVRHMGRLVRDRTIVPVQVHSWNDIDESVKKHLWQSILNKFGGEDLQRHETLDHMKRLWQFWRGLMKHDHIKEKATLEDALKDVPNHLTKEDWEWLLNEHYSKEEFKKTSARNSANRENLKMQPRMGSKSFRQVIWDEMGGKHGNQPGISEIFKKTRTRKCGTLEDDAAEKYVEIVDVENENPTLTPYEVVEMCFGPQDRDHVVCFGNGTKPKHVRGPLPSREELTIKIREKEKENLELQQRIDDMDASNKKEREEQQKKIDNLEGKIEWLMSMVMGNNVNGNNP